MIKELLFTGLILSFLSLVACNLKSDGDKAFVVEDTLDSTINGVGYDFNSSSLVIRKSKSGNPDLVHGIYINQHHLLIRFDSENQNNALKGIALSDEAIYIDAGERSNIVLVGLPLYESHEMADQDTSLLAGALYKISTERAIFSKPR